MKKYEISEEELKTLIGLAAARTCDDEEFKGNEALVMNAAAVIACKLTNHFRKMSWRYPEKRLLHRQKRWRYFHFY